MRKLLTFALLLLSFSAVARHVSLAEASKTAAEFFSKGGQSTVSTKMASALSSEDADQPYFIFNNAPGQGFVIISGDDRARKILGYSDHGSFNPDNMPPQLKNLLDQYARQISGIPNDEKIKVLKKDENRDLSDVQLTTSNFGQGYPFNQSTPLVDGKNTMTGCVATAMAIVMDYYQWPVSPRHSHAYYPSLSAEKDFMNYEEYTFDWDNVDRIEDKGAIISDLMRVAGHSVNMVYGLESSGTKSHIVANALRYYFGYSPECQYIERKNWSEDEWLDMLNSQLDNKRPVIYSAAKRIDDDSLDGHAFVIDGRKDGIFHINWGWNGNFNGYYELSALTPGSYDYNIDHGMIINIVPNRDEDIYSPCWIDNGYLWRELDEIGHSIINAGTHVSVENIYPGTTFDYVSKMINCPCDNSWQITVGLVDENDNIKYVFEGGTTLAKSDPSDFFCGINYTWNGVNLSGKFTCPDEVDPSWRLQTIVKRDDEDIWRLVTGTYEASSYCGLRDNNSGMVNINFDISPDADVEISSNTAHLSTAVAGTNYILILNPKGGVARYYINGKWNGSCDDTETGMVNFLLTDNEYNIKVEFTPYDKLIKKSLNVSAGSLKELVNEDDAKLISDLTLSGTIDANDIYYIQRYFHSLERLDLRDADIKGCTIDGISFADNTFPNYSREVFSS